MAIQNTGGVFENGEGGSLDFMVSIDGVHAEAFRRHGAASFNQHLGGPDAVTFGEQLLLVMYTAFIEDRTILDPGDDDDPDSDFDPADFPPPQEGDVPAGEQTEGASAVDGIGF